VVEVVVVEVEVVEVVVVVVVVLAVVLVKAVEVVILSNARVPLFASVVVVCELVFVNVENVALDQTIPAEVSELILKNLWK
jgi:hypothetical protein